MKLAEWQRAINNLHTLIRKHGHTTIPVPLAMSALQAENEETFYRRLGELREAGWFASVNERTQTLHAFIIASEQEEGDEWP